MECDGKGREGVYVVELQRAHLVAGPWRLAALAIPCGALLRDLREVKAAEASQHRGETLVLARRLQVLHVVFAAHPQRQSARLLLGHGGVRGRRRRLAVATARSRSNGCPAQLFG